MADRAELAAFVQRVRAGQEVTRAGGPASGGLVSTSVPLAPHDVKSVAIEALDRELLPETTTLEEAMRAVVEAGL